MLVMLADLSACDGCASCELFEAVELSGEPTLVELVWLETGGVAFMPAPESCAAAVLGVAVGLLTEGGAPAAD